MKITLCCMTCIIGEDTEKDPEESRLISNEPVQEENRSEPAVAEEPSTSLAAESSEKKDVTSPVASSQKTKLDKFRRAAGVTKRYNVMSQKYRLASDASITEETCLRLKIAVKIMPKGGMAKVFALDVFNVSAAMSNDSQESLDDRPIVQLRTKVLPSEIRGHSRKYEVQEGITGSLKFMNECLHTISLQEFQTSSIRFRLYHVFKHQRDHLLGEYILDDGSLDLDYGGSTTNIELILHDPTATDIKLPELCDVRRPISSSTSGSQNSVQSRSSFQTTTIRKSDTKVSSRRPLPSFRTSSENDDVSESTDVSDEKQTTTRKKKSLFQTIRKSASDREAGEATDEAVPIKKEKVDKATALEWLRKGGMERTEKVSELQNATEEMEQAAGNFSAVSVRLREKYEKKNKKKHSHESN